MNPTGTSIDDARPGVNPSCGKGERDGTAGEAEAVDASSAARAPNRPEPSRPCMVARACARSVVCRALKVTDEEMQVALPLLMAGQRANPSHWLDALIRRMLQEARRRELIALLALLELQAAQSEGPSREGPSAVPE